jgi:hypothetical protein
MKNSTPSGINLVTSDPLSIFLTKKLRLTPVRVGVVMFAIACIWRLVIPLGFRMRFPPSLDGTVLSFIELPFFWAYFIWSKEQIAHLFNSVIHNNLLHGVPEEKYNKFVSKVNFTYSKKWFYLLTALISLILTTIQVVMYYPNNSDIWYEPYKYPLYAFGEMLTYTLSQYIVVTIILTELILIGYLKEFFDDFEIRVHFDYPDKAGGWGEIGRHATGMSIFAVIFGVWMTGMTISAEAQFAFPLPIKAFFWFLFSLIAPIVFFAPLLSAHWAMQKYKFRVLQEVSEQINTLFDKSKEKLSSKEFDRQGTLKIVKELREWNDYLDKSIPTWPFPKVNFPSIAASWFLPLVSGLLTTYVDEYIRKAFNI